MEALGMIETKGLLAAIESADAMLKAAEVRLLERTFVGGGLVTITITGDVAAVKASIDAAEAAVCRLGSELLVSRHVIPRPHSELGESIISSTPLCELREKNIEQDTIAIAEPEVKMESDNNEIIIAETSEAGASEEIIDETAATEMHKEDMDKLVEQKGIQKAIEVIERCRVVKLRNLAREYSDFGITGRVISGANKAQLLEEFRKYYS